MFQLLSIGVLKSRCIFYLGYFLLLEPISPNFQLAHLKIPFQIFQNDYLVLFEATSSFMFATSPVFVISLHDSKFQSADPFGLSPNIENNNKYSQKNELNNFRKKVLPNHRAICIFVMR